MLDELYNHIFHRTADGILIANSERMIEHANPAAAMLLGMTVDQICGKEAAHVFQKNPALLNLFNRSGEQTNDVHLPRRRQAISTATSRSDVSHVVTLLVVADQSGLD